MTHFRGLDQLEHYSSFSIESSPRYCIFECSILYRCQGCRDRQTWSVIFKLFLVLVRSEIPKFFLILVRPGPALVPVRVSKMNLVLVPVSHKFLKNFNPLGPGSIGFGGSLIIRISERSSINYYDNHY